MTHIETLLDELHNLRSAVDAVRLQQKEAIDQAIPEELRAAVHEYRRIVAEVEAEFADKAETAAAKAAELEQQIKEAVKAGGATVKGKYIQAVFVQGRVSWNNKQLEGYAVTHPEITLFRKEGEPSVSLRVVNNA